MSSNNTASKISSIREWTPLNLNEHIPAFVKRGLFSVEVVFTCIDALPDFLAIGTNVGIVFWYNRNGEIQKLRTESVSRITCIKILDSVEYMIAAGCANGQVSVFRIQKPLPPDLNISALKKKPIERYTIRELHRTPVCCCEWSKNGMKLYSGDRQGIVVLTELDYQAHLSKSAEILSEAYEIVQLSVYRTYLLVSTLYRSCIVYRNTKTGNWQITQIGKKDRKQLVDCGGIFIKRNLNEPLLVVGRPGLRFWFADTDGNVEKTLIFRDAIQHSTAWEIPILNPKTIAPSVPVQINMCNANINETQNFRTFKLYTAPDTVILTHDEISLYLLNIDRLRVEAVARGLRKILDFCVCGNEIFILEGDRSVIRLAPTPEKPNRNAQIIFNPLLPPPVPNVLGAAASGLFESPIEYKPDKQKITNAEECFELPPIEPLNLNIPIELAVESPRAEQKRRLEVFNEISQMDFDQSILHRSGLLINGRKKRKNKTDEQERTIEKQTVNGIVEIGQFAKTNDNEEPEFEFEVQEKSEPISNSIEETTTHPTLMDASFCCSTASIENESYENNEKPQCELNLKLTSSHESLLTGTHISPISPIAAEEFERAQCLAISTGNTKDMKSPNYKLDYPNFPHQLRQNDLRLQNINPYNASLDTGFHDFSFGQPIDELCQALKATIKIEDSNSMEQNNVLAQNQHIQVKSQQQQQLQFVASQPTLEEVSSFLPDFRHLRDPLYRSPPPSGDSVTSSEWEFLEN